MSIDHQKLAQLRDSSSSLHILYVEDDEILRNSTLSILAELFPNITTANDGLDGLEKFKSNKFDLIISDIDMPNMDFIFPK